MPDDDGRFSASPGVTRTFCATCGSSLTDRYDYLPGQIYVSLGVLDQAQDHAPQKHAHELERFTWLHIGDDLERVSASGRAKIKDPPRIVCWAKNEKNEVPVGTSCDLPHFLESPIGDP